MGRHIDTHIMSGFIEVKCKHPVLRVCLCLCVRVGDIGSGFNTDNVLFILRGWGQGNTLGEDTEEPDSRWQKRKHFLEHIGVGYVMKFDEIHDEICIDTLNIELFI